jgi:nucleoid-associated protein YgaU
MKTANFLRRAAILLGTGLLVLSMAAATGAEDWNISSGDYLTPDEYKQLSDEEAQKYCESLAQEIDIQNDNAAAANSKLSDIDSEIDALKRQLADARSANDPLNAEIAELERQLKELSQLPRSYTVVPGDYLIKISGMPRIYSDEARWKRIFRANRDKIDDPNLIYPDQIFLIPRDVPSTHTVVEGESLAIISGYWEVYGDRSQWKRLYEGNNDKISDPNVITPGMTLQIPR